MFEVFEGLDHEIVVLIKAEQIRKAIEKKKEIVISQRFVRLMMKG